MGYNLYISWSWFLAFLPQILYYPHFPCGIFKLCITPLYSTRNLWYKADDLWVIRCRMPFWWMRKINFTTLPLYCHSGSYIFYVVRPVVSVPRQYLIKDAHSAFVHTYCTHYHYLRILDTASSMVTLCSVYKSPSHRPCFTLLTWFLAKKVYSAALYRPVQEEIQCSNDESLLKLGLGKWTRLMWWCCACRIAMAQLW